MNLRRKRLALTGALAVGLAGIGGGMSIAADTPLPTAATSEFDMDLDEGPNGEETDPEFTGSVPAPAEVDDAETDAAELGNLATTSSEQAEEAALAAVPGTVTSTELEDDEGYVVYQVEVQASDGTSVEVTVDAGDGTVLAQSTSDDDDSGEASDD